MDRSPALLLLLALGLCCPGTHSLQGEKRFMQYKTITYLELGAWLDLTCDISGEDTGVVWGHQDKVETFKFIVSISLMSGATFEGNQNTSKHFEARKEDVFYHLVVKSFTPQDEGNYFCIKDINKQLYFSPGQLAFLSEGMQEELNYICLVFLWVPLTGLCLLLLRLLATTIALCRRNAHHNLLDAPLA